MQHYVVSKLTLRSKGGKYENKWGDTKNGNKMIKLINGQLYKMLLP